MSFVKKKSTYKGFVEVLAFHCKEQLQVIRKYYCKSFSFFLFEVLFHFCYFFFNPYRISKNYVKKKKQADWHVYGETPLTTWEKIVNELKMTPEDTFLELGSGRGRLCFWTKVFISCRVIAVERIPLFVKIGKMLCSITRQKQVLFIQKQLHQMDFSLATVLYLYGTNFPNDQIMQLVEKCKKLPPHTKIVTISYSLVEYSPLDFSLLRSFPVRFPWGETSAYIQVPKTL